MKRRTLAHLEEVHGKPLDTLIPGLLAQLGTQQAVASHLGISQAAISTWLKQNGYVPVTVWRKVSQNDNNSPYQPAPLLQAS